MEPLKIFSIGAGATSLVMGTLAVVFGVKWNKLRKILANSPTTGVVVDSGSPGPPQAVPNGADFRGVGAKLFEFLRFMNKIEGGSFSDTVEGAFKEEFEMIELKNCNFHYSKVQSQDGSYVIDNVDIRAGQSGLNIKDAFEELREVRENELALLNITKDDLQKKINEVEGTNGTVIPSLYIGDDGIIRYDKSHKTHVELTLERAKEIVMRADIIEKTFSGYPVWRFKSVARGALEEFAERAFKAHKLAGSILDILLLGEEDFEVYSQFEERDPYFIKDCFSGLGEAYVKYAGEFGAFQDIRGKCNDKIEKAQNPGKNAAPLYVDQLKSEASEAQKVLDKLGELDKLVEDARKQAK